MSNKVTPKKRRGRPATGRDTHVSVRLPVEALDALERVAKAEASTRSEVIRVAVTDHLRRKGYLPK